MLSIAGAVPAYFAGLLPEGRRLSVLTHVVKTSADDELSLLLAVGSDPVGDVQVVPSGAAPQRVTARLEVEGHDFSYVRYADVLAGFDIDIDRVGLAGVQDKVSPSKLSLPVHGRSQEFILKLNPPGLAHLVENEAFFLAAGLRRRGWVPSGGCIRKPSIG